MNFRNIVFFSCDLSHRFTHILRSEITEISGFSKAHKLAEHRQIDCPFERFERLERGM
jgi:hypothetical protein